MKSPVPGLSAIVLSAKTAGDDDRYWQRIPWSAVLFPV